jgi:hypothetical protein
VCSLAIAFADEDQMLISLEHRSPQGATPALVTLRAG